jgi:hypothetical protein
MNINAMNIFKGIKNNIDSFWNIDDINNINFISQNEENITKDIPNIYLEYISLPKNQSKLSTKYFIKDPPDFCNIFDIMKIVEKYFDNDKEFIEKLKSNNAFENTKEYEILTQSKSIPKNKILRNKAAYFQPPRQNNEEKNKKTRGRPPNPSNNGIGNKHTKFGSDNIIKKIKAKFFEYGIYFLNKILNLNGSFKLKKLDYKYIDQIKREIDLLYFNLPLWKLFSLDVSRALESHNKKILGKIMEKLREIKNKNGSKSFNEINQRTVDFVLNMTFREFINLFTGKIKVEDLNIDKDMQEKIKNSIEGLGELLMNIKTKNDNDQNYFKKFIFYMFNYERAIYFKQLRKPKAKKNLK